MFVDDDGQAYFYQGGSALAFGGKLKDSMVEFKGQWYAFYHNSALSGMGNLRSVCVDSLTFNADGTIQKVVQTGDSMVIAELPPAAAKRYEAEDGVVGEGQEKFPHGEVSNGAAVNDMHLEGSFIEFSRIDAGNGGPVDMTIVYASDGGSGLGVEVNGVNATWIPCRGGEGWDTFTTAAMQRITLKPCTNNTIKLTGGGGGINVDYIAITPAI